MVIVDTLVQMTALIGLGLLTRHFNPTPLQVPQLRSAVTELVFYLLLPALVLKVLWQAQIGVQSLQISVVASSSILIAILFSWLIFKAWHTESRVTGAGILAASFANVTYLGLPLLTAALGDWAASIVIQYDLFASTPLVFTLGLWLAAYFGGKESELQPFQQLVRIPALWAALVAMVFNLAGVTLPQILDSVLDLLADAVIPLMLITIGLSLEWRGLQRKTWRPLLLVITIQLILMPLYVLGIVGYFTFSPDQQLALVLEAAMPSMMLGLVFCERFRLDTAFYAAAVTLSTLLSMVTLPYWFILAK